MIASGTAVWFTGGSFRAFGAAVWGGGGFRTDSFSCHQPPSFREQVAEREQREELGAVLGEPPVAGLHVTELPLEDAERVLDPGPHHGDDPVDLVVLGVKLAALRRLAQFTCKANAPGGC